MAATPAAVQAELGANGMNAQIIRATGSLSPAVATAKKR